MKRIFAIAIGICMLATAGATGTSNRHEQTSAAVDVSGSVTTSHLSAQQVKDLREKYRYYPASDYSGLRSPI